MRLTNEELIAEAIAINHREVAPRTLAKYRRHIEHLDEYLASAHSLTLLDARRKHLRLFMTHLASCGGPKPDPLRLPCTWCAIHNYPDTVKEGGWSASTRKSYLSAIRFLYAHCMEDEDLPDLDPTARMKSAKVVTTIGYTPTEAEGQAPAGGTGKAPRRTPRPLAVLRAVTARDVRTGAMGAHRPRRRRVAHSDREER